MWRVGCRVVVGAQRGALRVVDGGRSAVRLHGGDDAVGETGGLERDQVVGGGVIVAGLHLDGLDQYVVAQAGLGHPQDVVIADQVDAGQIRVGLERTLLRGGGLGTQYRRAGQAEQEYTDQP